MIDSGYCLILLDVISLFTNVPIDLAIECLTKIWYSISTNCKIPQKEFLDAVRLVLDPTFFTFDNQFYKQNFGTPMSSPLSPIIADIVIQELENTVLSAISFPIPIYYRFVDDIVMAVPETKTNFILDAFNKFHPRL